ncbi:hypothetical protein DYBT9623_04501 [Dyadobacter sp. CECT 9623]|uniref:Big-1 domain-containing protein n=2 Tax=Dyadobacter linearis TaxID=2823330 RepID=A0ABM8UW45_9BACT|nr:hypothetical protein DYBT9623_04501 [Dyadobacter sp. CECT 9623]
MNHMKKTFIVLLQLLLITAGCRNEIDIKSPAGVTEEEIKADAAFNNQIVEGVGNVIYAQKLERNTLSQLVLRVAYQGDTVAYFGKINAEGKLEYIHTSVYARENNSKLFVRQIYPDEGTGRMYTVSNGVKSRFVIESVNYNETDKQISILDYDWTTGKYKTLGSVVTRDGEIIADYSSERKMASECEKKEPTDEIDKNFNSHAQNIACGGVALDSYPVLATLKKLVESALQSGEGGANNPQAAKELTDLDESIIKQSDYEKKVTGKVEDLESLETDAPSFWDIVEKLYDKVTSPAGVPLFLVPFKEASDLDYNELEDDMVKLAFTVIHQETKLPFTELPVPIDMRIVVPGTSTVLYNLQPKFAHRANGQVVFRFDPYILPLTDLGETYPRVEVQYKFGFDSWSHFEKQFVNIKHNVPRVVDEQNNLLKFPLDFEEYKPKLFKLVQADGSTPIDPKNYAHMKLGKGANSKITASLETSSNGFYIKMSTSDLVTPSQLGIFRVTYKDRVLDELSFRLKLNTPTKIASVSGNAQTGAKGKLLPKPLKVRITNKDGEGVSNAIVNWVVTAGEGRLENAMVESDDDGYAEANWVLGDNELPQEVLVGSVNRAGEALAGSPLQFSAKVGPDYKIEILSKNVLGGYGNPFQVRVTDMEGKPIPQVEINWQAVKGFEIKSSENFTNALGIVEARGVITEFRGYSLKASLKNEESVAVSFNASEYISGMTYEGRKSNGFVIDYDPNVRRPNPFYIFFHDENLIPTVGMLVEWQIGTERAQVLTNGVGAIEVKWSDPEAKTVNFKILGKGKVLGSWSNLPL